MQPNDPKEGGVEPIKQKGRTMRADAKRNNDALLEAAKEIFAVSGVDAPVREIADKAGVGVGTFYRRFPQRSDLIAAVFRREVDACADSAPDLANTHAPFKALSLWIANFARFITTKRGLASALYAGSPAYENLPAYFDERLRPALEILLETAIMAGEVRRDVDAEDIISAVSSLCISTKIGSPEHAQRMVALFADGLRYGTDDGE